MNYDAARERGYAVASVLIDELNRLEPDARRWAYAAAVAVVNAHEREAWVANI